MIPSRNDYVLWKNKVHLVVKTRFRHEHNEYEMQIRPATGGLPFVVSFKDVVCTVAANSDGHRPEYGEVFFHDDDGPLEADSYRMESDGPAVFSTKTQLWYSWNDPRVRRVP